MNIALASDNNYTKYLHIVITSILEFNKSNEINFFILDSGIDECNKSKIKETVESYNKNITFINASFLTGNIVVDDAIAISSYSRLFLTRLSELDKIIYFDCDSLVNGDLLPLWNIDLSDCYFAGVLDFVDVYFRTILGLSSDYPYINAGMLVMNLKEMRNDEWENKVLDMIKRYKGTIPHCDQGIINVLSNGKFKIVKPKYNVLPDYLLHSIDGIMNSYQFVNYYSVEDIIEARNLPVFIHFAAGFYGRPWDKKCTSPLKQLYLNMIEKSGYSLDEILYDVPENKHMVFFRNIYQKYPHWIYVLIRKLISFRTELMWKYKLRNIEKV